MCLPQGTNGYNLGPLAQLGKGSYKLLFDTLRFLATGLAVDLAIYFRQMESGQALPGMQWLDPHALWSMSKGR